jgi:hypothetical protein
MNGRREWLDWILYQFVEQRPADCQPVEDIAERKELQSDLSVAHVCTGAAIWFRSLQFSRHSNKSAWRELGHLGRFQTMTPVPSASFSKKAARIGWAKLGSSSLMAR